MHISFKENAWNLETLTYAYSYRFEDLGAPLLVIADSVSTDGRSVVRYGDYLEVVL